MSDPGEPEDTVPFTHRPYGARGDDNPFVSPSGPAAEPSGPSYTAPLPLPPPGAAPVPYGSPTGQEPWQSAWAPVYGPPVAGAQDHKGANQAMVLGIVALSCLFASLFCCVTIPGVFCAPFAWVKGSRAKREIDAAPGFYGNRGQAQAGVVMGIIGSIGGALVVLVLVGFAILIGSGWSLV